MNALKIEPATSALNHPAQLSEGQEHTSPEPCARPFLIKRHETVRLMRRGVLVYRRRGVAGADLPVSPVEWDLDEAHRRYVADLCWLPQRAPDPQLGVAVRQERANTRRTRILAFYLQYRSRGRHCAALIAAKTKESLPYVRRVLRESARDPNR